jgi:hypothetical protein
MNNGMNNMNTQGMNANGMVNSKGFNSVNNMKLKFEKTTNFTNLGISKPLLNATGTAISDQGRYKKKGTGDAKRQSSSQTNTNGGGNN